MIRRLIHRGDALRKLMGMDRAIAYMFAARVSMIIGSTVTVLLIVHFLSKVEQGYYYTLLSLVNLQIIFELGFSFVVLQLAAHEAVHLKFHPDGAIEGHPERYARLAAILQKTVRWYLFSGLAMGVTLLPAGAWFFSRTAPGSSSTWLWPWTIAACATVAVFVFNPFCSFIEGCGQVRQVARMRFGQCFQGVFASWLCILLGKGLFAPALVLLGNVLVAGIFLWSRRNLLLRLFRETVNSNVLCWKTEVWGFQWKIAITWLCSYFTVQVLTPVLFAARGASEAGRLGMSISIAAYMWNLVFAWMSTKATPFGQLVAKQDFELLDHVFFRTLWQSVAVLACLVVICMTGIMVLQMLFPNLALRMVSPQLFALLLLTAISTLVVQSEAIYLRAHKEEPLIWQAVTVAVLTSAGAYLAAPRWGITGICFVYFVCTGIVGVISATFIFHDKRRSRRQRVAATTPISLEALS